MSLLQYLYFLYLALSANYSINPLLSVDLLRCQLAFRNYEIFFLISLSVAVKQYGWIYILFRYLICNFCYALQFNGIFQPIEQNRRYKTNRKYEVSFSFVFIKISIYFLYCLFFLLILHNVVSLHTNINTYVYSKASSALLLLPLNFTSVIAFANISFCIYFSDQLLNILFALALIRNH